MRLGTVVESRLNLDLVFFSNHFRLKHVVLKSTPTSRRPSRAVPLPDLLTVIYLGRYSVGISTQYC